MTYLRLISLIVLSFYIAVNVTIKTRVHTVVKTNFIIEKTIKPIDAKATSAAEENAEVIEYFENFDGLVSLHKSLDQLLYWNYVKTYKLYLIHGIGNGPPA
ncbi:MAG: hypothetical protein JNM93_03225 [Bacteriovoracaceae bacterium]|nr:hypothetical protein [Bacteriovoracaceae bacterium]